MNRSYVTRASVISCINNDTHCNGCSQTISEMQWWLVVRAPGKRTLQTWSNSNEHEQLFGPKMYQYEELSNQQTY